MLQLLFRFLFIYDCFLDRTVLGAVIVDDVGQVLLRRQECCVYDNVVFLLDQGKRVSSNVDCLQLRHSDRLALQFL